MSDQCCFGEIIVFVLETLVGISDKLALNGTMMENKEKELQKELNDSKEDFVSSQYAQVSFIAMCCTQMYITSVSFY